MNRIFLLFLVLSVSIPSYAQDTIPTTGTLKIGKKDSALPAMPSPFYGVEGVKGRRFGPNRIRLSLSSTSQGIGKDQTSLSVRIGNVSRLGYIYDLQYNGIEGRWHMAGMYVRHTVHVLLFKRSSEIRAVAEVNGTYGLYNYGERRGNHDKLGFAIGLNLNSNRLFSWEIMLEYQLQRSNNFKENGFAFTYRCYIF